MPEVYLMAEQRLQVLCVTQQTKLSANREPNTINFILK